MFVILTGLISKNRKHCNVTVVDITEYKLAEIKLLEAHENAELSSASSSAILGSSIDSIWAIDKDYKILYLNQDYQQEYSRRLVFGWNIFST